jgi:hypothetical protein
MHRMGHASLWAALIYQQATKARDRSIADAMSALVESSRAEALWSSDDGAYEADEAGAMVPVA